MPAGACCADLELILRRFLARRFAQRIESPALPLQLLIFVLVYVGALLVLVPGTPARTLLENIGILTASGTGALWVLRSVPDMPSPAKRTWLMLGIAQAGWFVGHFLMGYVGSLIPGVPMISIVASVIDLLSYAAAGLALVLYPFESPHAPTRFRFILDGFISAGAVVTIGFLVFVRPLSQVAPLSTSVVQIGYPLADLILLAILANFSLAKWLPRRTAAFLAAAWVLLLGADYVRTSLILIGNYQPGGIISLGWVCAPLLLGCGAAYERSLPPTESRRLQGKAPLPIDLGVQFQKVLPLALELVLFWYVLADWRLRGGLSSFAFWMSIVLGAMLIVRLGIRGGEAELDQYWRLFENLADPSFIADAGGTIRLSNPAYAALPSHKARAGPDRPSLLDVFEGISSDRLAEPLAIDQSFDATLRADGTPYLLTLSPIVGENRRLLIAGVAHNLREQKQQSDAIQSAYDELRVVHGRLEDLNARLEQRVEERTQTLQVAYDQLEEQNRVLQSLDQIKTDFVSMVSHELRAPLTNLGGGVELLLRHAHSSADTGILTSIQEEIKRLTRFVETILNVSAMEAGKLVLHPMPLSLPVLAHAARDGWSNTPDWRRIDIDMDEDLPLVIADEEALRSIIGHLLDNALKYAPDGPVRIAALHQGDHVLVEVTDSGPGVPLDKRPLLFQRFQRMDSKDSQAVYGYGLGLYISQRLLRSMGGSLEFEAPGDGGARFYFYLETAR